MKAPAPETIGIDTFREGPTGAMLFGGPTAARPPRRCSCCSTCSPAPTPTSCSTRWAARSTRRGRREAGGPALLIDLQEGPDLLLRVDPATKFLSAIELKIDPAQLAKSTPPGQTLAIDQFGWTAGTVSTQVPADRSFAFVAPKGFAPIEGQKEQPGGAARRRSTPCRRSSASPPPTSP